ncbi:MAG TPA: glycosyl hydrolase family 28-related protein [Gemmatimonadaceae bacterium]|nr:glycosyl hydrolase family 28-related protein [Gemmatimonadaceae bacterium]
MPRLPVVGSDLDTFGTILNEYLTVGHDSAGRHTAPVNIKERGAIGNNVANDSAAIQAVIDEVSAAGGGQVIVPPGNYKCNITLKGGVYLVGPGRQYTTSTGYVGAQFITAGTAEAVVDTPLTEIKSCGVIGINIRGSVTAGVVSRGIHFRSVVKGYIRDLHVNATNDESIRLDGACGACVLQDIQTTNSLRTRTRTTLAGTVDLNGTDHWVSAVEASTSAQIEGNVSSASQFCAAIVIRSTNGYYETLMAELSDVGIVLGGSINKVSDCRSDLNYGDGWQVTGERNQVVNAHSHANGQGLTNTYSGFVVSGASNQFANALVSRNSGDLVVYKHGFVDTVGNTARTGRNWYANPMCPAAIVGTAVWSISSTWAGPAPLVPPHQVRAPANLTSIDVADCRVVSLGAYSLATTVTAFTGGVNGQVIHLIGDAEVTIANGTALKTNTGANVVLAANRAYTFVYFDGVWYQD